MNSISSGGDPNPSDPNDPLHYAPPSMRGKASPQERPVSPVASRSGFDEMLKEAVAKSRRHPLDPELVDEPDQPRSLFRVAGRFAAAIGVAAIIGYLFFSMIPKSQGSDPTTAGGANAPDDSHHDSQALLRKFVQFDKSQDGRSAGAAETSSDDSQPLLQKFMQWQQKQQ